MAFSRREFVRLLGAGGAAVASSSGLIGYGREGAFAFEGFQQGSAAQRGQRPATTGPAPIRLSSNENLRGPSPKVIEALKARREATLARMATSGETQAIPPPPESEPGKSV